MEKIQWRKLFDLDPIYADLLDKIAARGFITSRVGGEWLPQLLWTGETAEEIDFDTLDPPYILKCNHGSGFNVVVEHRAALDVEKVWATLRACLAKSYGAPKREPGYLPIRPRLLAERLMREPDGATPLEHKIYVSDGRAQFVHTVIVDGAGARFATFHDRDWRCLRWRTNSPLYDRELARPQRLEDFLALAERLGAGFDHIRVDMYEWMGQPRVGELALYSWSGLTRLDPDEADFILGGCWQLQDPIRRAIKVIRKH